MIICQGCGQSFDLPEGYGRNKIQCPGCGVICAVPADAGRAPAKGAARPARKAAAREPEPSVEDQAASMLKEPEPVPLFDDEPAPQPPPTPAPKAKAKAKKPPVMLVPCRRCGSMIRRQRECPNCDGAVVPEEEEGSESPLGSLELGDPPPREPDEDDSPYLFADKEFPTCPKCKKDMPHDAVLCASCGYDLRTRRRTVREYEPIAKSWEADMTLERRLMWMGAGFGFHWLLAALSVATGTSGAWPFLVFFPPLVVILSFVLGTYDRITLTRDHKGRTKITKQWRAFFVPLAPKTTDVRGYEGVTTGQWHDAGFLEWYVFISLLPLGVIPALIWGYNAIYKQHFHVALALNHGHSEVYVYRGRSEEQMNDIADSVCDVGGMMRIG